MKVDLQQVEEAAKELYIRALKEPHHEGEHPAGDLNVRELFALAPILTLCLVLGVWPQRFFDVASRDLKTVAGMMDSARSRATKTTDAQGTDRAAIPAEGVR